MFEVHFRVDYSKAMHCVNGTTFTFHIAIGMKPDYMYAQYMECGRAKHFCFADWSTNNNYRIMLPLT